MAVRDPLDVVLVAFGFPPGFGPGVARPLAWANHLAARGHRVRVLTAPAEVQRAGGIFPSISPIEVDPRITVAHLPGLGIDLAATALSSLRLRRVFDLFLTAEAGWGMRVAQWLIRNVRPDTIVISTYTPSASLGSALLARMVKSFVWIADYRDPWILRDNPMPTQFHLSAATTVDRLIHQRASGVIYTSWIDMQNALYAYRASCPGLVVRNGVEVGEFSEPGAPRPASTILFAGNLYAAPENPVGRLDFIEDHYRRKIPYDYSTYSLVPLFRAVGSARRATNREIRVQTVGTVDRKTVGRALGMAGEDSNSDWVDVIGSTSKEMVALMSREAAALYLPVASRIDGKPSGWVPQKLFEMLAGDRPIITTARDGEAASLLRTRPGVFWLSGDNRDAATVDDALRCIPARPAGRRLFSRRSQALQVEGFAVRLLKSSQATR